jgi:hypothetical protein
MKWVLLAIVLVILPYTYLRWHFRKPGRAFEPYHDTKEHANTMRLLSAGFQRVVVPLDRPADAVANPQPRVNASAAIGGLPASLASTLVDSPPLPVEISAINAAAETNTLLPYAIEFTCTLPDNHQQPGGAQIFIRGEEIVAVPDLERLSGGLLARVRDNQVRINIPAGVLKPGRYHVTLVGSRTSRAWDLTVK